MDRLPLPLSLPFSPDLLWRYPLSGLSSSSSGQPPSSPLLDVKQQLPGALGNFQINQHQSQSIPINPNFLFFPFFFFLNIYCIGPDPRTWAREDVVTFLRWCEREFDLPGLDLEKFQMNGKTITTTTKNSNAIFG